jgi:hypothetical protein
VCVDGRRDEAQCGNVILGFDMTRLVVGLAVAMAAGYLAVYLVRDLLGGEDEARGLEGTIVSGRTGFFLVGAVLLFLGGAANAVIGMASVAT